MITIQKVETGKQRKEFVDFPNRLYQDTPQYLPFLYSDSLENGCTEIAGPLGFTDLDPEGMLVDSQAAVGV